MNESEPNPESLLRRAQSDPRPAAWVRSAARGMEARVLQRLAQPETWAEAIFSLTSWRPLAAALLALAVICLWTGRSVTDVFNEDWLTTQTAAESPDVLTDSDFAELEL